MRQLCCRFRWRGSAAPLRAVALPPQSRGAPRLVKAAAETPHFKTASEASGVRQLCCRFRWRGSAAPLRALALPPQSRGAPRLVKAAAEPPHSITASEALECGSSAAPLGGGAIATRLDHPPQNGLRARERHTELPRDVSRIQHDILLFEAGGEVADDLIDWRGEGRDRGTCASLRLGPSRHSPGEARSGDITPAMSPLRGLICVRNSVPGLMPWA